MPFKKTTLQLLIGSSFGIINSHFGLTSLPVVGIAPSWYCWSGMETILAAETTIKTNSNGSSSPKIKYGGGNGWKCQSFIQFHPPSSRLPPSLRFMALPGLLFTAFPDGFETLRTVLRRRGAVKHREAVRFMGDAKLVQWSKPKWTALSIDRDLWKKFRMFLSCRTQTSVASLPLWQEDSDSYWGRLPKTGDRWHAVSQYLKLHIAHSQVSRCKKKVWNWSSSQIGSKIDIHETSWNYVFKKKKT